MPIDIDPVFDSFERRVEEELQEEEQTTTKKDSKRNHAKGKPFDEKDRLRRLKKEKNEKLTPPDIQIKQTWGDSVSDDMSLLNKPTWDYRKPSKVQVDVHKFVKMLYFMDWSFIKVHLETGYPEHEWRANIPSWAVEKQEYDKEILERIRTNSLSDQAEELMFYGVEVVTRQLKRFYNDSAELSVKDLALLSQVLTNLHRVRQLELGKATNITLENQYTPKELLEILTTKQSELAEFSDVLPPELLTTPEALAPITGENRGRFDEG